MRASCAFALSSLFLIAGCATEDPVAFGDPANVVGGASSGSSAPTGASSGGSCSVDPSCQVRFSVDVFGSALSGTGKCSASSCHGAGISGLTLTEGDAKGAYAALTTYTLATHGAYVVPCDPASSMLLCNLKVDASSTNPYGSCGSLMPKVKPSDAVDDVPLSVPQIEAIAKWIQCGAPDN